MRVQSALVTCILAFLAGKSLVLAQSTGTAKPVTTPPAAAQSLEDQNRAVALRVFEEIFNQRRPEVAAEIYSPNFRNHGLHSDVSLEVDQGWARGELQAFPDLHMTVVKTVAENDLVTVLWIFRGTHTRYGYAGFPPTGTHMEFRGITIFRVVDGRIVEEWTTFNQWSAYSQALQHLRWWIIVAACLFLLAWLYIGHLAFMWLGRRRRLQGDGRISNQELADQVGPVSLSLPAQGEAVGKQWNHSKICRAARSGRGRVGITSDCGSPS